AHPVRRAPGEIEVAVFVGVGEVAAPVPPVAGGSGVRLGVVVVTLERPDARGVDDLPDALLRVEQPPGRVESCRWLLDAVVVDDLHRAAAVPERAGGIAGLADDADPTLGGAERVDDMDTEALGEAGDDRVGSLVAVG